MKAFVNYLNTMYTFGYVKEPLAEISDDLSVCGAYWSVLDYSQEKPFPEGIEADGQLGFWLPPDAAGKRLYYFGFRSRDKVSPEGFAAFEIAEGEYAQFNLDQGMAWSTAALADSVKAAWKEVFDTGLDKVDYVQDLTRIPFEYYRGISVQLYLPVMPK